jgi:hypothetical protein
MANIDLKLEIVVLPVSEWTAPRSSPRSSAGALHADLYSGNDFRVVQFTVPGSGCSIIFGQNVIATPPGLPRAST